MPGAIGTLDRWATKNKCREKSYTVSAPFDLATDIPGYESTAISATGCPPGVDVTVWKIDGANHSPAFVPDFADMVLNWFLAHPKVRL